MTRFKSLFSFVSFLLQKVQSLNIYRFLRRVFGHARVEYGQSFLQINDGEYELEYTFFAKKNTDIIGQAILAKEFSKGGGVSWRVFGLNVKWMYRRLGIAENLMRMALQTAKGCGSGIVNLAVSEKRLSAIDLYRKLGFKRVGRDNSTGQILMEKEI